MTVDRQHLVFDADDTLWENNVLFERAIDDFIAWMAHPTLEPTAIRTILQDIERANSTAHGYGSSVFLRSLHDCFEKLSERPADDAARASIEAFVQRLRSGQVELIPEVESTLATLGRRHDLLLLTKGAVEEQQRKIDASGLAGYFRRAVVVPEKDPEAYAALAAAEGLDPARSWMIGNSVKSDVNPALAAGFGAVFVPNASTWALEHADLPDPLPARFHEVARFPELLGLF
ncbi:HAD family hydrolase [Motilibacter aurantiacus]|uniref:HAD family hydrolase n=1 Tax=Motilibacter aurantiacus TaxID=2714955 RepID=UPI00140BBBCB|nr:HAD family hydrolase [Motilibacter aurantiacus]NHC46527.1 HAD family hydrolase [Motilibacter aurantiacus]